MSNYYVNGSALTSFFNTQTPQTGPTTNYKQSDGTDIGNSFTLYMFGTRSLCNYVNGTTDIGNYYQRDGFTRASVLITDYYGNYVNGVYNMSPWYVPWNQMSSAIWIWDITTAASGAPASVGIWFYYTFYYSGSTNSTIELWAVTDDVGYFSLNQGGYIDISYGWPGTSVSTYRGYVTVVNGLNYIRVYAYNNGGPAGLLISLYNQYQGGSIATTNGNWAISTGNALPYNPSAT